MNKKVILTAVAITVLGSGAFVTSQSFAQEATDDQKPMANMVQKIAEKFGLKEADVQAVFVANREEMHAKRKANFDSRLSQLVTEGKITEAQKKLIVAKHAELNATHESAMQNYKSMTQEERKAAKEKVRADLEAWAKANNIDVQYLNLGHGKMMHGGKGIDGPPQAR